MKLFITLIIVIFAALSRRHLIPAEHSDPSISLSLPDNERRPQKTTESILIAVIRLN